MKLLIKQAAKPLIARAGSATAALAAGAGYQGDIEALTAAFVVIMGVGLDLALSFSRKN